MALLRNYHGVQYQIPESKEKSWGPTVTALLASFCVDLDSLSTLSGAVPLLAMPTASTTLAAGGALTQTHPWHMVSGTPGAVTLSATTSITAGGRDGTLLVISGGANAVTILDGSGVLLNGNATVSAGRTIVLGWSSTLAVWAELARNF